MRRLHEESFTLLQHTANRKPLHASWARECFGGIYLSTLHTRRRTRPPVDFSTPEEGAHRLNINGVVSVPTLDHFGTAVMNFCQDN